MGAREGSEACSTRATRATLKPISEARVPQSQLSLWAAAFAGFSGILIGAGPRVGELKIGFGTAFLDGDHLEMLRATHTSLGEWEAEQYFRVVLAEQGDGPGVKVVASVQERHILDVKRLTSHTREDHRRRPKCPATSSGSTTSGGDVPMRARAVGARNPHRESRATTRHLTRCAS